MSSKLWQPSIALMIYLGVLSIFPFAKHFYKYKVISKNVHRFFGNLTRDAIQLRKSISIEAVTHQKDCLSHLLELMEKKNWKWSDLAPHTVTCYLDTYETTSVAIAQCFYQLGLHENVQRKLRQEITKTFYDNGEISIEKILEMEYLDQIFHGERKFIFFIIKIL